jgi:hypothetical protein
MHCAFCGSEVPDNARFCLSCGKEIMRPGSSDTIFVTQEATEETKAPEIDAGESRPDDRLFSRGERRILVIVGIIAGLAVLALLMTWGILSIRKQLQQNRSDKANETIEDTTATQTQVTTASEAVASSESTTIATESTLSAQEINAAVLDDYYTGTLIPMYGEADVSPFDLECGWYAGFMDLLEFMPEDRKGIVNRLKEDLDGDGIDELMVVISGTFGSPIEHYTETDGGYTYWTHYDGIEIKIFRVVGGTVQEMISDNKEMVYDDLFMYPSQAAIQICILENGGNKYIYVMRYNSYINEGSTDIFNHDFYAVEETGIRCLSSTKTYNGKIYDELELSSGFSGGELIFSIWDGDILEDYYGALRARLEPFGLDCSWMDAYYDEIIADDTISEFTYSDGLNQSGTPLEDLIDNIRVITIVDGVYNDYVQTYDISRLGAIS